jgi:hypothetical protein
MKQALELFELMQARRSADVENTPTVEALHVDVAPRQAEPLSFMTLQTVEGIVGSMEFCTPQGQTLWESKMEKFLNLGHAYSSENTVTGENTTWLTRHCTGTYFLRWQQGNKINSY